MDSGTLSNGVWCGLLVCVLALGMPRDVSAQDDPNQPALPDIAPRVVEIRGQLEISLPSLQRQPLLGFNPPPRVAPIPPDRRPFVEEYKQESVDLPPSPLTPPEPPPVASLIGRTPRIGLLEAAGGRYFTRSVRFRTEWPMTQRAAVFSRVDYRGTDGHTPEDVVDDVSASSNILDALVGIEHASRQIRLTAELDGFLHTYRLFAAQPGIGAGGLVDEPPIRDGRGGGLTLRARTQAITNADVEAAVAYDVARFETDAADGAGQGIEFFREERVLSAETAADVPLAGRQRIIGDAAYTMISFDDDATHDAVHAFDGAGGLALSVGRALELSALARFMTYSIGDAGSHAFVSPDLRLDFHPLSGFGLYAQNRPRAEHHTTASSYLDSPYLIDDPDLEPTVYTIDARAGGRILVDVFEADVHVGYSLAPNYRYFERATIGEAGGYVRGFVAPRYEEASIAYFGGDVAVNLPAGFNLSGGLTFREGQLTASDDDIPYFGPIVGRGALSYSFSDGRGFLQALTTYESARRVARGEARRIGDYFDLDIEGSYDVTSVFGALVRLENLSAGYLERWEHYDQSPFVVTAGLRARW